LSRVVITFYFTGNQLLSFSTVDYIIRESFYRWIFRFIHANRASIFLILIFLHICRRLFNFSFSKSHFWSSRVTILLLAIRAAFLRYVLPWRQISFWRATVITNLVSVIPFYGNTILSYIWRNFSVSRSTLTRFYSLHFLIPLIIFRLIFLHLFLLYFYTSNSMLRNWNFSKLKLFNFYVIKDIFRFALILFLLNFYIFLSPLFFMDADNWIFANPIVTPNHIKPEWYFLYAYAILRCIPIKSLRVFALVYSILIYLPLSIFMEKFLTLRFLKINFFSKFIFIFWIFNFWFLI